MGKFRETMCTHNESAGLLLAMCCNLGQKVQSKMNANFEENTLKFEKAISKSISR